MDPKSFVFRFGEFEVPERELRLTRAGASLALEPKALRVLLYLLHNPGRLVTKDELLNAVWGDTAVTENSLTRAVALLRKVLDDDIREPQFISTVPTAGYRFIAQVAVSANGNQAAAQSSVVATNGKDGYGANSLISNPDSSLKDVPIATLPRRGVRRWPRQICRHSKMARTGGDRLYLHRRVGCLVYAPSIASTAHIGLCPNHPRWPPERPCRNRRQQALSLFLVSVSKAFCRLG